MEKKNVDKENEEIALQAHFNERDKKAEGNCPMNKGRGNFQNLVEENSKVPKIQHSKRMKTWTIWLLDQTTIEVSI